MATAILRPLRYFRNFYHCRECETTWTDDAMTVCESWCPDCGTASEPYDAFAKFDLVEYVDGDD